MIFSPMKVKCDHTNMLFRIELVLATQQAPRKAHAPPTYRAVDRHVERGVPAGGQQANPTHNTQPCGHDENSSSSASNQRSSDGDEGVDFANYMEPGIVLASQSSTSLRKLQRNNNSQKRYVGSPVTEATYSQRTVGSEGHVVLNRVSKRHLRLLESQEEEEEEEEGNNNNVN